MSTENFNSYDSLVSPQKRRQNFVSIISDPQLMTAVLANSQNSEHICPICNAKYNNVGNFKQHMKSHDTEQFREQRNAILSEMIATSYSKF